jgi:hypothetical protein
MSRALDSTLAAALADGVIQPAFFVQLGFRSETVYVWSGVGDYVLDTQTYKGVGSLGTVGAIAEGLEVKADGTSVTLSGVDPNLLNESLSDIKSGAPAMIKFGLFSSGALLGAPYLLFSGIVDKATVTTGVDTVSITLALESRLLDLGRATQRRYTAADQQLDYPDDSGYNWVEALSDITLRWGN